MDAALFSALSRVYDYETWALRTQTAARLFVAGFKPRGNELPGWEMSVLRVLTPPPPLVPAAELAPVAPPPKATRSLWSPAGHGSEVLLDLQVIECPDRAAAHELLLLTLGEFESQALVRRDDLGYGDVCFTSPGASAVLFVRGNLVHVIRNAGRRAIPLLDPAGKLDQSLISPPDLQPAARAAAAALQEQEIHLAESVPLSTAPTRSAMIESAIPKVEYRVFSQGGDVFWEGDSLVYRPDEPGEHDVTVYVVGSQGSPQLTENFHFYVK